MRTLLERWRDGTLDRKGSQELILVHQHHFRRRVIRLGPSYFPGTEKNEPSIASLAHGAFAAFEQEPFRDGLPAFAYALEPRFRSPLGILYYWRGAATIEFLEREGPPILGERRRLRRNVHQALSRLTPVAADRGRPLFGVESSSAPFEGDLSRLVVDVQGLKIPDAVHRILRLAGRPLTPEELLDVLERNLRFLTETSLAPGSIVEQAGASEPTAEAAVLDDELAARIERFYAGLRPEERRLLVARGYGGDGAKLASFDSVAAAWGSRSKEWCRSTERAVLEAFRGLIERDEQRAAVGHLTRLIAAEAIAAEEVST